MPTTKYLYTRRVYTILLESYYNKLFSYLIKFKVDDATRSSDRSTIMGNMRRSDILEKNLGKVKATTDFYQERPIFYIDISLTRANSACIYPITCRLS